jgi:hypothetical protein
VVDWRGHRVRQLAAFLSMRSVLCDHVHEYPRLQNSKHIGVPDGLLGGGPFTIAKPNEKAPVVVSPSLTSHKPYAKIPAVSRRWPQCSRLVFGESCPTSPSVRELFPQGPLANSVTAGFAKDVDDVNQ